jgi:dipeptidyl aminopeptidase/acylaminoacyl peptidase
LGENPDPKLVENLSNELQVTKDTPPTFLFHTTTDATVPVENSVMFYSALRKAGVPAEMHIFELGPHGTHMGSDQPPARHELTIFPTLLANWLQLHGWMAPESQ